MTTQPFQNLATSLCSSVVDPSPLDQASTAWNGHSLHGSDRAPHQTRNLPRRQRQSTNGVADRWPFEQPLAPTAAIQVRSIDKFDDDDVVRWKMNIYRKNARPTACVRQAAKAWTRIPNDFSVMTLVIHRHGGLPCIVAVWNDWKSETNPESRTLLTWAAFFERPRWLCAICKLNSSGGENDD